MEESKKPDLLSKYKQALESLEEIIFNLNDDNIDISFENTMNIIKDNFSLCSSLAFIRMIYSSFISQMKDYNIYFNYMNKIEKEIGGNNYKLIKSFANFLLKLDSQESYFLLDRMINLGLISSDLVMYKETFYFAHYSTKEFLDKMLNDRDIPFSRNFSSNIKELQKNDWELHKKLIKEGVNPNEIAKIIRNDEIEKLQEISSQQNFNFNQAIEPSLYERYSFVNKKNVVTLIDYAAFFSSVKCFKYLLMNGAKSENTGKYAVSGGNLEIFHLCEQNHSSFKNAYEVAIEYYRNDIFKYIYENKISDIFHFQLINLFLFPTKEYINFSLCKFLLEEIGIKVNFNNKDDYIFHSNFI